MTTIDEAKQMARRLRASLRARGHPLGHSEALELVAAQLGHRDWNTATAALGRTGDGFKLAVRPQPDVLTQLREARAQAVAHFEQSPQPQAEAFLSRIDAKIAEVEQTAAEWATTAAQWQALGVFSKGMEVPLDCPELWQQVDQWRRTGEAKLPNPLFTNEIHRLSIYELPTKGRTITFAAAEVRPDAYAFYVPVKDRV